MRVWALEGHFSEKNILLGPSYRLQDQKGVLPEVEGQTDHQGPRLSQVSITFKENVGRSE